MEQALQPIDILIFDIDKLSTKPCSIGPKFAPFNQSGVLIKDFTLLEIQCFAGLRVWFLNKWLILQMLKIEMITVKTGWYKSPSRRRSLYKGFAMNSGWPSLSAK